MGAESLSLICHNLTGHTILAGWQGNGIGPAERQDLFEALSWIYPSSLPDRATEPRCSASLDKSESRPAASTCPGGFYNQVEWEQAVEAEQTLE